MLLRRSCRLGGLLFSWWCEPNLDRDKRMKSNSSYSMGKMYLVMGKVVCLQHCYSTRLTHTPFRHMRSTGLTQARPVSMLYLAAQISDKLESPEISHPEEPAVQDVWPTTKGTTNLRARPHPRSSRYDVNQRRELHRRFRQTSGVEE